MINNTKLFILLILSSILLSNCSSVQESLDRQNKNNSEEFLVEKKSSLSIPPNFEELPVPSNEKIDKKSPTSNIESLIIEKNNDTKKLENVDLDEDFEKSLLDKIKNN